MLATGFTVLDEDPMVEELRELGRAQLAAGPAYTEKTRVFRRYAAAPASEDGADRAARDPATAAMILGRAVTAMLEYAYVKENRWIPRAKDLLAGLDPALAADARRFFEAARADVDLARRIADRTIGVHGFFAWEGEREDLSPSDERG